MVPSRRALSTHFHCSCFSGPRHWAHTNHAVCEVILVIWPFWHPLLSCLEMAVCSERMLWLMWSVETVTSQPGALTS